MGLIGSSGKLSNYEFQGVAPDVHLIALKVLDSTGAGKASDVINLSLGHPIYAPAGDDPLVQAVEQPPPPGSSP
jgi:hypothetical protein